MELIVSESPEALAEKAAADFCTLVRTAVTERGRCTVALSGGTSPKGFYARLTQSPYHDSVPWEKLWIFWGDERCVPPDHPESNYRLAQEILLQHVPALPSQVFRMRGEDPPPEAARAYEKTLHDTFGAAASWPVFDLILLGLGLDGHTASLFPGTSALKEDLRWATENVVRSLQTVRLTLTFPTINQARQVWFLVSGAKKREVFARLQGQPDETCPASLVRPVTGELKGYVDQSVMPADCKPASSN